MFQTHASETCSDACLRCAAECEYCAEACRQDPECDQLGDCIALVTVCAQMCRLAAEMIKRDSPFAQDIVKACAEICQVCCAESEHHPHDHCQRCARRCHECLEECQRVAMLAAHGA